MADIEHRVLTGADLHEPKGIETASSEEVYAADGAGSGDWVDVNTLVAAATGASGVSGQAFGGDMLPLPAGKTLAQCVYIVSPVSLTQFDEIKSYRCYVDGTGQIVADKVVSTETLGDLTVTLTVNYLTIGVS